MKQVMVIAASVLLAGCSATVGPTEQPKQIESREPFALEVAFYPSPKPGCNYGR